MTSIYLVEYGRGALARWVTFFVDVMTGIPSIVAGLFAYALFVLFFGEGIRTTSLVMQMRPHRIRFIDSIHVSSTPGAAAKIRFF